MTKILESLGDVLWGAPVLVLILGVGMFLSVRTGFAQFRLFPRALASFWEALRGKGSSYQALCTALAATVGTGNLVGVAGAICLGGPGSIFWMWVCGFFGMATKYAEATLAVRYREGSRGGPMYMIQKGLGGNWQWLAKLYAVLGFFAAFGVGNATQINAIVTGIHSVCDQYDLTAPADLDVLLAACLTALVGMLLSGGGKRIGQAAERLVPFASCGYILLCMGVLMARLDRVPATFSAIFQGAFSPKAVTGGLIGSAFAALRVGCARGVFTNEAGLGTASIAHAGSEVTHPAQQGLMGIMEVFLDTILICTLTALAILVSGVSIPYGVDAGGSLTTRSFVSVYGDWVSVFLAAALICFAIATVLGWSLYGGRCAEFLLGSRGWGIFISMQTVTVFLSSISEPGPVWVLAEIFNGLMAIPNLIALAALSPELRRLTIEFKEKSGP